MRCNVGSLYKCSHGNTRNYVKHTIKHDAQHPGHEWTCNQYLLISLLCKEKNAVLLLMICVSIISHYQARQLIYIVSSDNLFVTVGRIFVKHNKGIVRASLTLPTCLL